jgi:hypothetical protein
LAIAGGEDAGSAALSARRADWFNRPRAYPVAGSASAAEEKALCQFRALPVAVDAALDRAWQSIGPSPVPAASASGVAADVAGSSSTGAIFAPGVSVHPSSNAIAFGGVRGSGAQALRGGAWQSAAGRSCDGGFTAIDQLMPTTVLVTCGDLQPAASAAPFLFRSMSGGASNDFAPAQSGIDAGDPASYFPPLAGDPSTSGTFYLGTNRVYRTRNGAAAWTAISGDLTGKAGNYLTAVSVAPGDPNTLYAGSIDGVVQVTSNALGGAPRFVRVTAGLPNRSVTSIAVDPADARIAYAGFSGFSAVAGDKLGHVFQTNNGGAQWNDISGNLPDVPVNAIAVDPAVAGRVYIGTDFGVAVTSDGGATWSVLGAGLPGVPVVSLSLHEASRTLRAATYGGGAWDYALGGLPSFHLASISPVSVAAGSSSFSLTLSGNGFTSESQIIVGPTAVKAAAVHEDGSIDAVIPGGAVRGGGAYSVRVSNGGETSNALTLAATNPVPTVSSISPTTDPVGTTTFSMTVTGTNFVSNSVVNFGPTVSLTPAAGSVTSTTITVEVPESAIAAAASVNVTVTNPAPGGGTSNAEQFLISDYSFGNVATVTVKAGHAAVFEIPMIALNGFDLDVTLTCSNGLPSQANCTFSPTEIVPTTSGANEQLSISTVTNSLVPPAGRELRWPPISRGWWMAAAAVFLAWMAAWFLWMGRRFSFAPPRRFAVGAALAMILFLGALAGCGSRAANTGTPVGTYLITVTGTATGGASHYTTITLIVQ